MDNIRSGALEVINKALRETIEGGTAPEAWSAADKGKYFLILDVRNAILRRVDRTFAMRRKKRPTE